MLKILIADDHALVREGLKKVLSDEPDFVIAAEAQNAAEVLDKLLNNKIDFILLDITMPGRSGLEVLKDIKKEYPKIPVLVLSMHPEERFAIRSIKAGASGYLTKESATDELVNAIKKILHGGKYISDSLAGKLAEELGKEYKQNIHELLSNREYEVLCLIASGKTISHIADELSLSVTTVSTYRARILEKTGMKNNSELTHYAFSKNLID